MKNKILLLAIICSFAAYAVPNYPKLQLQLDKAIRNNEAKLFRKTVTRMARFHAEQKGKSQQLSNQELKQGLKNRIRRSEIKVLGLPSSDAQIDATVEHELQFADAVTRRLCFDQSLRKKLVGTIVARQSGFGSDGFDYIGAGGTTPLTLAIQYKRAGFVDGLIAHGASAHFTDCNGDLPVDIAIFYRDQNIVNALYNAMDSQGCNS